MRGGSDTSFYDESPPAWRIKRTVCIILYFYTNLWVIASFGLYLFSYVNTMRAVLNRSHIPSVCTHTWPRKLILNLRLWNCSETGYRSCASLQALQIHGESCLSTKWTNDSFALHVLPVKWDRSVLVSLKVIGRTLRTLVLFHPVLTSLSG